MVAFGVDDAEPVSGMRDFPVGLTTDVSDAFGRMVEAKGLGAVVPSPSPSPDAHMHSPVAADDLPQSPTGRRQWSEVTWTELVQRVHESTGSAPRSRANAYEILQAAGQQPDN